MPKDYDFCGWATKNDIRCSDGRIIGKDAFKHCSGTIVPLVWNHGHKEMRDVIGHALLENREQGVYAYCSLNDTEDGEIAKKIVKHRDVTSLSIFANNLKHASDRRTVVHGDIKELSLVLAGANPGATIEALAHGEDADNFEEMIFSTGEELFLEHSDEDKSDEDGDEKKDPETTDKEDQDAEGSEKEPEKDPENSDGEDKGEKEDPKDDPEDKIQHSEGESKMDEKTVGDVLKTFNQEQTDVLNYLVGNALEEGAKKDGGEDMKHNLFEGEDMNDKTVLSHSDLETIATKAKSVGSYREAFNAYCEDNDLDANSLQHADGDYGVENLGYLFPEARAINNVPNFIKRDMGWVDKVMGAVHTTPFARVKSIDAKITEDEARAKGYLKGKLKKEEVFSLLKRTTDPQTIYKKQKFDRDDIIDITDFDVIAWVKGEMKMMLNEEIARAVLIGDGRLASSEDKIAEDHIRPVATDAELYTIQAEVNPAAGVSVWTEFIDEAVRSRKRYKGSGNPTLYCTEDCLIECMLLKDNIGHRLYKTDAELAMAMRVKEIVTVPVMENYKAKDGTSDLLGVIVNLTDYNIGTNKGGQTSFFDDFDIDFNQYKYLIETRLSGALIKPYSAIALYHAAA